MKKYQKSLLWCGIPVLILAIVLAVFFSLRGDANNALEEELFQQVFEVNKSTDPARYLGDAAFGLLSATTAQRQQLEETYTDTLDALFPADSWLREQKLEILERKKSQTEDDSLRSLDLVCLDWKVDSLELNGDTAEMVVSYICAEKIIIKSEQQYQAMFPLTAETDRATLRRIGDRWIIEDLKIENYQLGAEDEASKRSFESFEEAYAYSMEKTPQNRELRL